MHTVTTVALKHKSKSAQYPKLGGPGGFKTHFFFLGRLDLCVKKEKFAFICHLGRC